MIIPNHVQDKGDSNQSYGHKDDEKKGPWVAQ